MRQNIYDDEGFFDEYGKLSRSIYGLEGAAEWGSMERMLPGLDGLDVVDLGCGYGWFCRDARKKGARGVLGIDISGRMLDRAREMTSDEGIVYRREDLEMLQLEEDRYDLAYSSLTLHYISDLKKLTETVYRSLRPGGRFVFSVEHPIYTARKRAGWVVDGGERMWGVNSYQLEGWRTTDWLGREVRKQHRQIGTYVNTLIGSGYVIGHVEEWGPTEEQVSKNALLGEERERPMFLLIWAGKSL